MTKNGKNNFLIASPKELAAHVKKVILDSGKRSDVSQLRISLTILCLNSTFSEYRKQLLYVHKNESLPEKLVNIEFSKNSKNDVIAIENMDIEEFDGLEPKEIEFPNSEIYKDLQEFFINANAINFCELGDFQLLDTITGMEYLKDTTGLLDNEQLEIAFKDTITDGDVIANEK